MDPGGVLWWGGMCLQQVGLMGGDGVSVLESGFVEATGRRGWWSVDVMWKVFLKRGWEESGRRVMWWCRVGRNEISTEGGDSEWRCICVARGASGICCLLLGIHMGLVKWFFLDCFRMWGNDTESVSAAIPSWRITTLMWLLTVLRTALLWRGSCCDIAEERGCD